MAKLYTLSEDYRRLMEMVEYELDNNEEIDEDTLEMFVDTLDSIKDSIDKKCEGIVKLMKNLESDVEGFKSEEKRLAKRRKTIENKIEGLHTYMEQMLRNANIDLVQAGNFKVKFQKNPPSVEILNEKDVPEKFKSYELKISKKEILSKLKAGENVSGVVLIKDKKSLRIS